MTLRPRRRNALLVLCCVGFAGWGSPANAQDRGCTCSTAASQSATGQIVSARGEVLASRTHGLAPAARGEPVGAGSQVVTGNKASATVRIGTCTLRLGPNSEMTVAKSGQNLCLRVAEAGASGEASEAEAEIAGGAVGAFDTAVMLGGAGAVGAGAVVLGTVGGGSTAVSD